MQVEFVDALATANVRATAAAVEQFVEPAPDPAEFGLTVAEQPLVLVVLVQRAAGTAHAVEHKSIIAGPATVKFQQLEQRKQFKFVAAE